MSNAHFAKVPNINIPRSKFKMPTNLTTTFNHGQLIPIDWFAVLPGDTFTLNLSSLIRMSAPIFPIMDNIEMYIHAFFVPMRLVWKHTEEFFGDNKESSGYQTADYEIPGESLIADFGLSGVSVYEHPNSLAAYLGYQFDYTYDPETEFTQSVLPARCYHLIWTEWYRAQQLQNPFILNLDDADGYYDEWTVGFKDGKNFSVVLSNDEKVVVPYQVCKKFDYFTAATLAPQYGESVTLPLGTFAPVVAGPIMAGSHRNQDVVNIGNNGGQISNIDVGDKLYLKGSGAANIADLRVDLSEATAATINSIRYAFQMQKYLERSNFGSRFFEMLSVHYGVTSPDARLQRPEYLGGTKFAINVNQVLSTAGYDAGQDNKVGQLGAVSVTTNKSHIFTKGFVEPGYIMIMCSTKQDQTYAQGVQKELLKKNRFEIYSPEFSNIGDQPILNCELGVGGQDDLGVFGYQESWAEYRYRPNRVSGLARPDVQGALDYITLANKFNSTPVLGPTFIQESRDNITRALTTGAEGPDYLADFYFDYIAVRELPTYSIPGLVDHFGVM